jgi:hypothetical protein
MWALIVLMWALVAWVLWRTRGNGAADEPWDLGADEIPGTTIPALGEDDDDGNDDVDGPAEPGSGLTTPTPNDVVAAAASSNPDGQVIASLPVSHLARKNGGNWKIKRLAFRRGSLRKDFQGGPALHVAYPKGSGTGKHGKYGGMGVDAVPKGLPKTAAKFSFSAWFAEGFNFARGGKLGGFMIGRGKASGCRFSSTGASHRVVFRPNGGVASYIYWPLGVTQRGLKRRKCGTIINDHAAGTLRRGQWNNIVVGVRLNSIRNGVPWADGTAFLRVNGGKPKVYNGIVWRTRTDMGISSIVFDTFFGGPDPSPKYNVAAFRNFKVRTY